MIETRTKWVDDHISFEGTSPNKELLEESFQAHYERFNSIGYELSSFKRGRKYLLFGDYTIKAKFENEQ